MPSFIHQAALEPHLDLESFNQICDACNHFNFAGLCTNLIRIPEARKRIATNKKTSLIAVIAFPFGAIPSKIKKIEAEWASEHGADEIEVVPNFLKLHQGDIQNFAEELADINEIGLPCRVILDTNQLSHEKLTIAIEACLEAGISEIQTGTGFGPKTTKSHILKLVSITKNRCAIKAAGGIKSLVEVIELIEAGTKFIGTSVGMNLIKEFQAQKQ
ncbi:deoxyribose-phosphate aldolase [Prochlorococcus marinus]|uniref:deoxyribose-phosphate aldolase n=1 Tax=Prochlorococcus marinus TaxID=1219 RepID=UPI0022B54D29|nr:deoxyribose-phosphate aldolase [Prochlorococcus marinus]